MTQTSPASTASAYHSLLCLGAGLALALSSPGSGWGEVEGETADADRAAHKIFTTVMSPYCPGLLLGSCPSQAAVALRDTIRAQLRRGREPEAIIDALVETYGEDILGMPRYEGIGVIAWLGPLVALMVGMVAVYRWLRTRRVAPVPSGAADTQKQDGLRRRVEEELQDFE